MPGATQRILRFIRFAGIVGLHHWCCIGFIGSPLSPSFQALRPRHGLSLALFAHRPAFPPYFPSCRLAPLVVTNLPCRNEKVDGNGNQGVLLRKYQRELARMQGEMRRIEALETQKRELVEKLREASGFVLDADLVRKETKRTRVFRRM